MNTELKLSAIDDMGFDFRHVVGDVVNLIYVMIVYFAGQCLFETASNMTGQYLTVYKSVIGRRLHGRQIICTFRAGQRCANKLPVRQVNVITADRFLKTFDVVTAYLVAEPARAAMDLHHNLLFN